MLSFHTPSFADLPFLVKALGHYTGRLCDLSPGNVLFWRDYYDIAIAEEADTLILRYTEEGGYLYALPCGAEPEGALCALMDHERQRGASALTLCNLTGEEAEALLARYPQATKLESERDWCDYLYPAADICSLVGKRFSGQRNHINKFKKLYPDGHFEPLTAENLPLLRAFCEAYFKGGVGKVTDVSDIEYESLCEQLDRWDDYRQLGGILLVEGQAVGFSVGEVVGDTLIIHTEKANIAYDGVYPMLVKEFANAFVTDGVRYINREEDCGETGLRTSKLSYHPCALLDKYTVIVPITR